jgi:glycine cleavage system H protein
MEFPDNLKYTKEHEWARLEGTRVVIGITDFAQDELGDVVFVELPEPDTAVEAMGTFGVVESVKAVSDLFSPIGGTVVEVNTDLEERPELVNQSPYDDGWMIVIDASNPDDVQQLMSAAEYQAYLRQEQSS